MSSVQPILGISKSLLLFATVLVSSSSSSPARKSLRLQSRTDSHDARVSGFTHLLDWVQNAVDTHLSEKGREDVPRIKDVLEFSRPHEERFVVARRDIASGELLLRLPMQLLMHAGYYKGDGKSHENRTTMHGVHNDSQLAPAMQEALSLDDKELTTYVAPQTWLAVYMMEHRRMGVASVWSMYLDLLPSSFLSNPIFYTDTEWGWMRGSTFPDRVQRHRGSLKDQYETVGELIPGFAQNYTLEDFLWARTAISSRVFGWQLPGLPAEDTAFMVPLGDMFNHRSPKQIEWIFNDELKALDYWARENISKGDELLISYGGKCNSHYLLHYGFALPDISSRLPPLSTVRVQLPLDQGVPDREARELWLVKSNMLPAGSPLPPEEFEFKSGWKGSAASSMLSYARLLSLSSKELDRRLRTKTCNAFSSPPQCKRPLGLENEKSAITRCLEAFSAALANFPTTVEEDEAILDSSSLADGVPRFLVILRKDEKIVLKWWVWFWQLALDASKAQTAAEVDTIAELQFGSLGEERRYLKELKVLITVEQKRLQSDILEKEL